MEIGTGIALGTLCLSAGAVCITAIRSKTPPPPPPEKNNGGQNGNGKPHPLCAEHSGVAVCLEHIKENQGRHETWLKSTAHEVKEVKELLIKFAAGKGIVE